MKKIIAFILVLMLCGCTVVRIDTSNIDTIVDVVLSKDNNLFNRVGKGYKYYVPKGVTYVDTNELNEILYSNGNYYYLYIDAIGYYNSREDEYEIDKDAYYSRVIKKEDGFKSNGYLNVLKRGDKYHIEFIYNYSKIEAVVDEYELNDTILNSAYILSTVKFNYDIIALMLNEEYFTSGEEKFELFKDE